MMKRLLTLAACLALAGPVSAETLGEKTGVNSVLGISPTTADFVKEAAISDMFEVQSSQLAAQKSNGATKDFATRMVADHTKTSDELKAMVQDGSLKADLPTALDSAHQSMLDKLKNLSGNDFDKQYHKDQDSGHKDAVSLFERYSKGGDNQKLKEWATKTLPTLQEHYKMAKDLDK
jgi:putative membrane protein